jgi:hypothetical protein
MQRLHYDYEPPPLEYRQVLAAVVRTLLNETRDYRLSMLTPEQAHYWLTNLSLEEVQIAYWKATPVVPRNSGIAA